MNRVWQTQAVVIRYTACSAVLNHGSFIYIRDSYTVFAPMQYFSHSYYKLQISEIKSVIKRISKTQYMFYNRVGIQQEIEVILVKHENDSDVHT